MGVGTETGKRGNDHLAQNAMGPVENEKIESLKNDKK
jgi:hypothetical protein